MLRCSLSYTKVIIKSVPSNKKVLFLYLHQQQLFVSCLYTYNNLYEQRGKTYLLLILPAHSNSGIRRVKLSYTKGIAQEHQRYSIGLLQYFAQDYSSTSIGLLQYSLLDYSSTCIGLLQYFYWITPVLLSESIKVLHRCTASTIAILAVYHGFISCLCI